MVDELILVDDASSDQTVDVARRLGLTTFVHEKKLGYGANQKTCFRRSVNYGLEVVWSSISFRLWRRRVMSPTWLKPFPTFRVRSAYYRNAVDATPPAVELLKTARGRRVRFKCRVRARI